MLVALVTVGALGILTAVGLLGSWLEATLNVSPPGGPELDSSDWYRSFPLSLAIVSALYAGLIEEVLLVAVPVGIAGWVARKMKARSPGAWMIAGGLAGLAFRSAMHAYQGWTSPLMVLVWGGGLLWIYLLWQSVYPLIAAHALHNFVIAWLAPQTEIALVARVCVVLLGVSALLFVGTRLRSSAVDVGVQESGSCR